jgi:uncharacterized protein
MQFEWDAEKAAANARRHRVTFEEGETVFRDPALPNVSGPRPLARRTSVHRDGYSTRGRLLIVSYTERQGRIRIISCRVATRKERRRYEEAEDDLTGPG